MEIRYEKQYSYRLNRDMEMKVYGHAGKVMLFIPCQNGRFFDFENFHMLEKFSPWIESGRLQVFSIDTLDEESWSAQWKDCRQRIERHEQWYEYIMDEVVPQMRGRAWERNGEQDSKLMVFGCSMGAMHAANLFFRRPDVFDTVLALSGLYDSRDSFGDYMDDLVYQNSPCDYLMNLPADHYYMDLYRRSRMIFCVGQGAWEDILLEGTRRLDYVTKTKGIPAWIDFWGQDVSHDWYWWYRQVDYFVPKLLGDIY